MMYKLSQMGKANPTVLGFVCGLFLCLAFFGAVYLWAQGADATVLKTHDAPPAATKTERWAVTNADAGGIAHVEVRNAEFQTNPTGTATATNTQASSHQMRLEGSFWTGAAETKHTFVLQNVASTTVNEGRSLQIFDDTTQLGSLDNSGNLNVIGIYKDNGTSGATTTCSAGQYLDASTTKGGIVTGGTCTALAGAAQSGTGWTRDGINGYTYLTTSTDKVGIGTSTPGSKLEIKGATSDNTAAALNATNSTGTSLLYVRNDGNIGMGNNTSPGFALDVTGTAKASTALISPILKPASDSTTAVELQTSGGTNVLDVDTTNKRVGINNAAPGYDLDVTGTAKASTALISPILQPASDSTTALQLQTSGGTNVLDVDTTNIRVGINRPNPSYELDVFGSARVTSWLITPLVKPPLNSTTAIMVADAGGGSAIIDVDTTNKRVGVNNTAPGYDLDVTGTAKASTALITPIVKPASDSTTAIQLENSGGTATILNVDTTNSRIGVGSSSPSYLIDASLTNANTNTEDIVTTLEHRTSGAAANGIGSALLFQAQNGAGTSVNATQISGLLTTVTAGSEASSLKFYTRTGGAALANNMTLDKSGNLNITGVYQDGGTSGLASTTCSAGYALTGSTVTGGIVTAGTCTNVTGGASSSIWTESGTTDYLTTTTNSVGIGAASASYKLDVTGNLRSTTDAYLATSSGNLEVGGTGAARGKLYVKGSTTTQITADIQMVAGQTANPFVIESATPSNLFVVDTNGSIVTAGNATFTSPSNSTTAFQVQNSTPTTVFDVDTTNGRVGIGNASPSYTLDVTGTAKASTALISPIHKPASDSITAIQLQTSGGTNVLDVDTTNSRVGIGNAAPGDALDVGTGTATGFIRNLRTWGLNARVQGLQIMPEGSVSDDGAGNLTFGGTVIVMNPAAGSWIRVASGTYAIGAWGYLYINMPPTSTRGTTVTPTVGAWSDADRVYDGQDRLVLCQRVSSGAIFCRFPVGANIAQGTVGTAALRTATGSATSTLTTTIGTAVTMNDYAYFPSYTCTGNPCETSTNGHSPDMRSENNTADPSNTTGAIEIGAAAGTATLRWRYATASDDPHLYVGYRAKTGLINTAWVSEDPPSHLYPDIMPVQMTEDSEGENEFWKEGEKKYSYERIPVPSLAQIGEIMKRLKLEHDRKLWDYVNRFFRDKFMPGGHLYWHPEKYALRGPLQTYHSVEDLSKDFSRMVLNTPSLRDTPLPEGKNTPSADADTPLPEGNLNSPSEKGWHQAKPDDGVIRNSKLSTPKWNAKAQELARYHLLSWVAQRASEVYHNGVIASSALLAWFGRINLQTKQWELKPKAETDKINLRIPKGARKRAEAEIKRKQQDEEERWKRYLLDEMTYRVAKRLKSSRESILDIGYLRSAVSRLQSAVGRLPSAGTLDSKLQTLNSKLEATIQHRISNIEHQISSIQTSNSELQALNSKLSSEAQRTQRNSELASVQVHQDWMLSHLGLRVDRLEEQGQIKEGGTTSSGEDQKKEGLAPDQLSAIYSLTSQVRELQSENKGLKEALNELKSQVKEMAVKGQEHGGRQVSSLPDPLSPVSSSSMDRFSPWKGGVSPWILFCLFSCSLYVLWRRRN